MTTQFAPGTPNWIELGSTDVSAAREFYGTLFGWTFEDLGSDAGGYGFIRKDGKQVAGIGPASDSDRRTSWAVYFATDDADSVAKLVGEHGGTVVVSPMDVMGQGRMAVFQDPTGAFFSVWQPGEHRGVEVVDAPGALGWVELMTPDIEAAKEFYAAVLPVTTRDAEMPGGSYTLLRVGGKDVAGAMEIGPEHGPMPSAWSVYFDLEDCDATADKAVELGGTEMMRDDMPPGKLAFLTDPQGGKFCIIQPNPDFSM
jgi:uncharacterized protein